MLFSQMPWWLVAVFLVICFVVKHFAAEKVEQSSWYKERVAERSFMGALNVVSLLNGVLTFLIFLLFAGFWWSLVLGLIDLVLHWCTGYYKAKKKLPEFSKEKLLSAWNAIRALHATAYAGFIVWATDMLTKLKDLPFFQ